MSDYQQSLDFESRRKKAQTVWQLFSAYYVSVPPCLITQDETILHLLHAPHLGLKCLSSLFFPIQVQFYCLDLYFCLLTP